VPIHLRAEPGDYAPAVLLPGDPLRAERIAREFMDDARQVNGERGMLGYTGTHQGKPVSVQSTGMGCPSAAIVVEELIQLGVKRLIRVGTCGGLSRSLQMGDVVVGISAVPADRTALHYVGGEPHAPTADFGLAHGGSALEKSRIDDDRGDAVHGASSCRLTGTAVQDGSERVGGRWKREASSAGKSSSRRTAVWPGAA